MHTALVNGWVALASMLFIGCVEGRGRDPTPATAREVRGASLCAEIDGRERCMSLSVGDSSIELWTREPSNPRQAFDVVQVHDDLYLIGYGGGSYNCLDVPVFQEEGPVGLAPCIAGVFDPRAAAQLWTLEPIPGTSAVQIRSAVSRSFCLAAMWRRPRERGVVVGLSRCQDSPGPAQRWTIQP